MVLTIRKSSHWFVSATLVLLGLVILNVEPSLPKAVAKNNPPCGSGTYDPNTQDCCCESGGTSCTVIDKATQSCCCGTPYDFSTSGCCSCTNRIYDLGTQGCCGTAI
jgi:hypothetical protein